MSIYKQQKEYIRKSILDTATYLFKEKGYDKVPVDEITKNVGIAKGTLYNFYESKKDILMAWSTNKFKEMRTDVHNLANPGKSAEDNLNNLIETLCQLIEQDQTLFFYFIRELLRSDKVAASNGEFDFAALLYMIIINSKDYSTIGPHCLDYKIKIINSSLFYEILDWFYGGKPIEDLQIHLKCILRACLYGMYTTMQEKNITK